MAAGELQRSLKIDTQANHSLFYKSVDPRTNTLREPTSDEQIGRLANLIKHHTKSIAAGTPIDQQKDHQMIRFHKTASFNQALMDYCRYRWHAFRFLKRRISNPLANYDLLDLDDEY